MGQIKLIASDLDRTLLRHDESLSPYTRAVLARCREKGVLFFVATARPPRALENLIGGLTYDGALCHNGGVVVLNGEIVWEHGIAPDVALHLLRRLQREFPQATISAEIGGELYANFGADKLWFGTPYHFTDFSVFPDKPAEKLMLGLQFPEQVKEVDACLPEGLYCQVSDNKIIMIQPKGVEKGKALNAICERLGISAAQTVGFGDDWNDISLLQACGVGVAVGNALPEVKKAADEICASNEEDGPARWLEEHLLLALADHGGTVY